MRAALTDQSQVAQSPLVSVLVPVYNGARFLAETLETIRVQSYRNLEIVIRDNCSTDATYEIAQRFVASDERFRVVRTAVNEGASANYIELLNLAQGAYIKYCNADDLLDPECVELLLAPMLADPGVALSTSSRRLINEDGAEIPAETFSVPLSTENVVFNGRAIARVILATMTNVIGEPSTTLFRHPGAKLDTLGFGPRDPLIMGDLGIWLTLLMRGDLYVHGVPLSSFRRHKAQESQRWDVDFLAPLDASTFVEGAVEYRLYDGVAGLAGLRDKVLDDLSYRHRVASATQDPKVRDFIPALTDAIGRLVQLC